MTELIKCECGGAILISNTLSESKRLYRVECWDCDRKTIWCKTEAEAIEAWNAERSEEK